MRRAGEESTGCADERSLIEATEPQAQARGRSSDFVPPVAGAPGSDGSRELKFAARDDGTNVPTVLWRTRLCFSYEKSEFRASYIR